jgi:hypothetical protein
LQGEKISGEGTVEKSSKCDHFKPLKCKGFQTQFKYCFLQIVTVGFYSKIKAGQYSFEAQKDLSC